MNISQSDKIAGYTAIQIRDLLRRSDGSPFTDELAVEYLSLSRQTAAALMERLQAEGYVENTGETCGGRAVYRLGDKAARLTGAYATKPIRRATAAKDLADFMARVAEVNANEELAYKVSSVIVFGSYLGEKEKLSDVDVAVELVKRTDDTGEFHRLHDARRTLAFKSGRTFRNLGEEVCWPHIEVLRMLKARSRTISLVEFHTIEKMEGLRYRVFFGDPEKIACLLKNGIPVPG